MNANPEAARSAPPASIFPAALRPERASSVGAPRRSSVKTTASCGGGEGARMARSCISANKIVVGGGPRCSLISVGIGASYNLDLPLEVKGDAGKNRSKPVSPGDERQQGRQALRLVAVLTDPFYEAKGLIMSWRNHGNQRRYPREVLRRVSLIKVAQRLGIPLAAIKEAFELCLPKGRRTDGYKDWKRSAVGRLACGRGQPHPSRGSRGFATSLQAASAAACP